VDTLRKGRKTKKFVEYYGVEYVTKNIGQKKRRKEK